MRLRLSELAKRLDVPLHGDGSVEIRGVAGIREAKTGELTFLGNPKYASYVATTQASAIIMAEVPTGSRIPILQATQPHLTYVKALKIFSNDQIGLVPGIHPTSIVGKDVRLGKEISIGPHVVIGDEAVLGDSLAIRPLTKELLSSDDGIRESAAESLIQIGGSPIADTLATIEKEDHVSKLKIDEALNFLRDKDPGVRLYCLKVLGKKVES